MKKSTKSSSTRRKATGSMARSKSVKGTASPATKTFGGEKYAKKACSATKTGAKSTAKKLRTAGKAARVVKAGKGYCVYSRG